MYETTNLRILRLRHRITLQEFAVAVRVSNQQISRVELLQVHVTRDLERKYEGAMEKVIIRRYDAVKALEDDYHAVKDGLLHETEESLIE